MCGIAGVFDLGGIEPGFEQGARARACLDALRRRGPDGSGVWRAPSGYAVLLHTRLAIVDPSDAGAQPMVAEGGSAAITYNGEIYNAQDHREQLTARGRVFRSSCDTEVLLEGWREWGEAVFDRLHGMYAFAAWDDRERRLLAAVDHAGMKPLCWSMRGGRIFVASDTDALRALMGGDVTIDRSGLQRVLTLSCSPAPGTIWSGIHKLQPGRGLRWGGGSPPDVFRHWEPPDGVSSGVRGADFDAAFDQVAGEHMFADVPVGAFLSGGIDSAAIVAGAVHAGCAPQCYTLSMDGESDESAEARRVSERFGLAHTVAAAGDDLEHELGAYASAYDEPQGYSALLNATQISALASKEHKAIIAGDGGDEAFGGYLWQREDGPDAWQRLPEDKSLCRDDPELSRRVADPSADDDARKRARLAFGSRSFAHAYAWRVFPGFHPAEAAALTDSAEIDPSEWLAAEDHAEMPHVRRVQRLDLVGFCAASVLPKVDRSAMLVGLEVRAPLLDRRLLGMGLTAPIQDSELRSDGSGSRPELRRYVADRVGPWATHRAKQGFSLRVDAEHRRWQALEHVVDEGPLVRSGLLREDWRRFVPVGDTPRLRMLVMLSGWARPRL